MYGSAKKPIAPAPNISAGTEWAVAGTGDFDPRLMPVLKRALAKQRDDRFETADAGDVFGTEADYPFTLRPRRYNPAATLLPLALTYRYWLRVETTLRARVEGADRLDDVARELEADRIGEPRHPQPQRGRAEQRASRRDDHGAHGLAAHDMAVVVDFDPLGDVGQFERVGQ